MELRAPCRGYPSASQYASVRYKDAAFSHQPIMLVTYRLRNTRRRVPVLFHEHDETRDPVMVFLCPFSGRLANACTCQH